MHKFQHHFIFHVRETRTFDAIHFSRNYPETFDPGFQVGQKSPVVGPGELQ